MTTPFRAALFSGAVLLAASAFAPAALAQDATPAEAASAEAPAADAPAIDAPAVESPAAVVPPVAAATPGELGKPAAGKGQVVFFRQSKLMGAALSFKVREKDAELGKLSNGVYFVLDFDPGLHEFVVHSEVKDVTPIEVEEGEVYYLQFGLSVGVLAGRPNLTPSTQEAFDAIAAKMKPSKWSPEAK
ncbi:MAG: DUF2846 domain-containing protein [Caulobacter sp.]|nr:DUF2846 domain-containing protein [Caulobacter sp.]